MESLTPREKHLVDLATEMRKAQKLVNRTHKTQDLIAAKKLEAGFDLLLGSIKYEGEEEESRILKGE